MGGILNAMCKASCLSSADLEALAGSVLQLHAWFQAYSWDITWQSGLVRTASCFHLRWPCCHVPVQLQEPVSAALRTLTRQHAQEASFCSCVTLCLQHHMDYMALKLTPCSLPPGAQRLWRGADGGAGGHVRRRTAGALAIRAHRLLRPAAALPQVAGGESAPWRRGPLLPPQPAGVVSAVDQVIAACSHRQSCSNFIQLALFLQRCRRWAGWWCSALTTRRC